MNQKISKLVKKIQQDLKKSADPVYQKTLYGYFKQQVEIRGLKAKPIENIFNTYWSEQKEKLSFQEKYQIGLELLKTPYLEDRCLGMRILNKIHKEIDNSNIDTIQQVILSGNLKDWGSIDTLCGRVFTPWTLLSKQNTEYIAQWRFQSDNLWVRRATCVTFVNRAKKGDEKPNFKGFSDLMFDICQETIQYDERFNQLGNGWLMRGLTLSNRKRAIKFIEDNYDSYSREGLRYAIEKLDEKERKRLLYYKKNLNKTDNSQNSESQQQEESEEEYKEENKKPKLKNKAIKKPKTKKKQ